MNAATVDLSISQPVVALWLTLQAHSARAARAVRGNAGMPSRRGWVWRLRAVCQETVDGRHFPHG